MSFFAGKIKTIVSSVTYNMAGDADKRPNFRRQAMLYLNAAGESIGEQLPRMYLGSVGVKLNRAYRWAGQSEQGLPTASVDLWQYKDFEAAVQSLLDAQYGAGHYKVQDSYITGDNTAQVIEKYLHDAYGWDAATHKMTNPPAGFTADDNLRWRQKPGDLTNARAYTIEFRHVLHIDYADPDLAVDVVLDVDDGLQSAQLTALVSEYWESTRSDKTETRAFATGDTTHTTTSSTTTTSGSRVTVTTTTVTMTVSGSTTTIRTKIVDATTSEATGRTYTLGTGQWPTLDTVWNSRGVVEKAFFPSLPFRVDNEDMLDTKYENTSNFQTVKKVCQLLSIDAFQVQAQINDNKDIKDIDYAFLQPGANMNTRSQAEMDYLFRFWDLCLERQSSTKADLTAWEALPFANKPKPPSNRLTIQDDESKNGAYKIQIEWDYIEKTTVTGQFKPGAKINELDIVRGTSVTYDYTSNDTRNMMDSTLVTIYKQISDTQYQMLTISGAVHKNDVYKGHWVETLAKDAVGDPDNNGGFLVPLHMGILNEMPLARRTQLAQECLYLVFNCYVQYKKPWYASTAFKIILAIIAIIIIICSWGSATPGVIAAWCATFGAVVGLLLYIAINFAIGYVVSYLMGKWKSGFISVFGEKWAAVVMCIIQIVVSVYSGGGFSGQTWLQTAVQIINYASEIFAAYIKGESLELSADYKKYMDQAEADKKRLEALESEFFPDNQLVSIDYLLRLQKTLREDSPNTFLTRTLLVGSDIVDITMGQISEMVSMNIKPRLQGITY